LVKRRVLVRIGIGIRVRLGKPNPKLNPSTLQLALGCVRLAINALLVKR